MSNPSGSVQLPYLVDVPTLAEHLGVPESHVRRLVFERRVPFIKLGRLLRFDTDDVDRWLAASSVPVGGRHTGPADVAVLPLRREPSDSIGGRFAGHLESGPSDRSR